MVLITTQVAPIALRRALVRAPRPSTGEAARPRALSWAAAFGYDPGAMRQPLVLALLVYLALDFAAPNMPGALNFDPDQSVDAISTESRATPPAPVLAVPSPVPIATTTETLSERTPRVSVPALIPRVTWSQRPRALLSVRTSTSPEAH